MCRCPARFFAVVLALLACTPGGAAQQPILTPEHLVPGALLPQPGDTLRVYHLEGELAPGDSTLRSGEYYDGLNVRLEAYEAGEAVLTSDAFNPYLIAVGPTGIVLQNGDFAGSPTGARVVWRAGKVPEDWGLAATSYAPGETGPYKLDLRELTDAGYERAARRALALARADSLRLAARTAQAGGQLDAARTAYEQERVLRAAALGPESRGVALILSDLSLVLQSQGDYDAARGLSERALEVYETTYGPENLEVASAAGNLATLLEDQGDYAAARPLVERALAIRERALGPDHPDVALTLNNLGSLLLSAGDSEGARAALERALAIYEAAPGGDSTNVAHTLVNLASLHAVQERYAEARPLHDRAIRILEAVHGPEHPAVANALSNLATMLDAQGDYAGAREILERALRLYEAALGPDHPDVAIALNNLATVLSKQGDYPAARAAYERALALYEAAFGPDHPSVATTLNNLGVLLDDAGDYAAAERVYERALAIREAALGPGHPHVAATLNNLAALYVARGRFDEARLRYDRALAILEAAFGPDHTEVATAVSNLAYLLKQQGRFAEARPLYERALRLYEAALGPDHPDVALALSNLGGLLSAQGDHRAARPLYERALAIREAALGPDHPEVGNDLNNLAFLLDALGDYDAARPLYERALTINEAAFGPDHPSVATALSNLALVLYVQEDYDAARPMLERALALREATFGPDHPDVAISLNNLAALYEKQGDLEAARPLYERALRVWEAALGPDHATVAIALNNLALLLEKQGDRAAARPLVLRAGRLLDRHAEAVLPALAPAEQRAFVADDLPGQVGGLLSFFDGHGLAEAYALVAGWKGLLLEGLRRQAAVAALAGDPAHAEDAARLREVRAEIAARYRRAGEGEAAERQARLDALSAEKERLERTLAAALPEGALTDPWREGGLERLRAVLPAGTAFVDLHRHFRWNRGDGVHHYSAVVAAPGGVLRLVDLGAADRLDSLAGVWRDAVTAGRDADAETVALAEALWGPLAAALPPGTARTWVSPDGALVNVPWAALTEAYGRAHAAADGIPTGGVPDLVAQVPSARALLRLLTRAADASAPPTLLLVGGVDFGGDGAPFAPLPGTAREVEALAALAGQEGLDAVVLTGEGPTAGAVAEALRRATYAHLATHGFFYGESEAAYAARGAAPGGAASTRTEVLGGEGAPVVDPAANRNPLAESGLALAGANEGPGGSLTAEELVGLDLASTRLVVLSACETGRGAEVTGQGVLGLQASFQAAGARALLMSLWSVPDASTAALMEAFYRALWEGGRSAAAALAEAQAAVRARPEWSVPVHWAAWVLTGEAW
jgi:tetratricopeptide (TPR) repeat protein/CHAT domain-containing protein